MKNLLLTLFLVQSIFAFSQDYIFWGDFIGNEIGRMNTDGTGVISVTTESTTRGLAVDSDNEIVYYVEGTRKQVKKVGFDGSNPETIITVSNPSQIDFDSKASHLYVSDIDDNAIYRLNTDGSDLFEFISGVESPSTVKLNLDESALYFMSRGATSTTFYRSDLSNTDGLAGAELLFSVNATSATFDIDFDLKKIYWSDRTNGEIRRADLTGENIETVAIGNDKIASVRVDPFNKKVYWSDPENSQIMVSDVENGSPETVKSGITGLSQIVLRIERPIVETAPTTDLYWGDFFSADLRKLNKDEKDIQILVMNENTPRGMAVDLSKNKLFWVEATVDELKSSDLDGSNRQTIASFTNPGSVALDVENEQAYVVDLDEDVIKRVNYDGSGATDIIGTNDDLVSLFLEFGEEKIYWLQKGSRSQFYKANFDGSDEELLFETLNDVKNFDVDYWNEKIYFTDRTEKAIRRCNYDGSDMETLASSFEQTNVIKVDPANNRIYWTEPTKNRIRTSNLDGTDARTVVNESTGIAGITLGISNTSSVKNIRPEFFDILPNPASDILTFDAEKQGKISIISADGKIHLSQRSEIGQNRINIQDLTHGNYFLILEENGKSKFSKFVKTE